MTDNDNSFDNIFYVKELDKYFVLIYLLGYGSYASVWYCIYFNNHSKNSKLKKTDIKYCALKIHNIGDDDEAEKDISINKSLFFNNQKSPYINYPLFDFEYDDRKIIAYDIAYSSLYDFVKLYRQFINSEFIDSCYNQMKNAIQFIHNCNYIHCDVRPENFLIFYPNSKQSYYYNLFINHNFFKKSSDFKSNLLNFYNSIFNNNNNDSNDDIECESVDSDNYEDSDCESYSSYPDEYNKFQNIFFINKNIKNKKNKENKENKEDKEDKEDKENKEEKNIKEIIKNPIIKITDFGLMQHFSDKKKTVQTRYYRAPENILGLDYDYKIDYWSLECSYYEILTGEILFDVEKDELSKIYDKDLVHLKQIIEKLNCKDYIINLIKKSPRKLYFLDKKNQLLFFDVCKCNHLSFDLQRKNRMVDLQSKKRMFDYSFDQTLIIPVNDGKKPHISELLKP